MHNDDRGREQRKRSRMPQTRAALPTRQADEATSLEVDLMMLDYMAYNAIEQCLVSMDDDTSSAQYREPVQLAGTLQSIDDLLNLLKTRDPGWAPDPELRFRLLLLKFTTLFVQRHQDYDSHSRQVSGIDDHTNSSGVSASASNRATSFSSLTLRSLRAENSARARRWIGTADRLPTASCDASAYDNSNDLPISTQDAKQWRKILWGLQAQHDDLDEDEAIEINIDNHVPFRYLTLLDLLPTFMHLSAACHALYDRVVSERWMQLVAGIMRAACLEQYLACGASGTDALDEAFAWGCMQDDEYAESDGLSTREALEHRRTNEIESMFRAVISDSSDLVGTETDDWLRLRNIALTQLCPAPMASLYEHLARMAQVYPPAQDSANLQHFLGDVANCIPKPVLVQLETGQLDGMTAQQTKEFLENCGVREGDLF